MSTATAHRLKSQYYRERAYLPGKSCDWTGSTPGWQAQGFADGESVGFPGNRQAPAQLGVGLCCMGTVGGC